MGVILFQLLTGKLPFEADNPTQVVLMHMTVPVPDPRQVAGERNIADSLARVVLKAMSKEAADRYQDAAEFSEALKTALDESQSRPPAAARSLSMRPPGATIECRVCAAVVPMTRFC